LEILSPQDLPEPIMSPHVQCRILRRLGYMQTQVGCGRVVCRHCRGCLAQWRDLCLTVKYTPSR